MAYRYSYSPGGILTAVVNFFLALVVGLLTIRVILRLFSANSSASFVNWIYTTTDTLMTPFRGIFPSPSIRPGGYVLDLPALFAIIVYALVGYLILVLVGWLPSPLGDSDVVDDRPARRRIIRR